MNGWQWLATVLIGGGLLPCLAVACRGTAPVRLLGLAMAGPITVMALAAVAQGSGQQSQFVVPLVLAAMAFTGTLLLIRLLGNLP